jgi:hypothetical protein
MTLRRTQVERTETIDQNDDGRSSCGKVCSIRKALHTQRCEATWKNVGKAQFA